MNEQTRREWAAADAVFDRLLDLDPDQRHAAMAAMGLAPEVRARVERLLAADASGATPLDQPLAATATPRHLEG